MSLSSDTFTAPGPSPDEIVNVRQQLAMLWDCASQLRPEWRLALLLNLPSVGGTGRSTGRGEIDVFPANRIASIAEIGRVLDLTDDQYELLFTDLGVALAETRTRLDGRSLFYAVWRHLPLPDKTVGALLGKTGMQVLGLRKLAIRQVAACMAVKTGAQEVA